MSGLQDLIKLRNWVSDQIELEERHSYHGTQKTIAYRRVLARLHPIVKRLQRVERELVGFEISRSEEDE